MISTPTRSIAAVPNVRGLIALLAGSLGLAVSACDENARLPAIELSGNTMGTTYSIAIVDPGADSELHGLESRIEARLEQLENTASTYRNTSEISRFNRNRSTDWIAVSDEFCNMVSDALSMARETGGAFDITVGPLVDLWGFGPIDIVGVPPSDDDIDLARKAVGFTKLHTDCNQPAMRKLLPNVQIDLSGWAKGYAVDQLAELVNIAGHENFLVEIGGEIKIHGHNADHRRFAVAIEKPSRHLQEKYSIIHLSNTGLATSGDYRNFFVHEGTRYSHTIDPRTGRPTRHKLSAVTVIHTSTAYADAMATAILVLGPVEGMMLANRLGIGAYFAVSTSAGLEFRSSEAFSAARYFSNHARM